MPLLPLRRVILRPVGETSAFTGVTLHFELLSSSWIRSAEVLLTYVVFWALILPAALGPYITLMNLVLAHCDLFRDWPKWIMPTVVIGGGPVWVAVLVMIAGARVKGRLLARPWANAADSSVSNR